MDHLIFDKQKLLRGLRDIKMYAHIKYFAIIFMSITHNSMLRMYQFFALAIYGKNDIRKILYVLYIILREHMNR